MSTLKTKLVEDRNQAMRLGDKPRLSVIRLILAALLSYEKDHNLSVTDDLVITILQKMVKQRKEAIAQYQAGQRTDLAHKEEQEIQLIQQYLPALLSPTEIVQAIDTAISQVQAHSLKDMGKVMTVLKPALHGKADMSAVSQMVRDKLQSVSP